MKNQNFKLLNIDSDFSIDKMIRFCSHAQDDRPELKANENLSIKNWENSPNTLLHAIYIQKRFDDVRAGYRGVAVEDELVAGGGFYQLDGFANACLISCRTYTIPEFRSKMLHGHILVPEFISAAKLLNYKVALFTFNDYNLWLKTAIIRFGKNIESYNGWTELNFPILVKHTKQWGLYKMLDTDYEQQFTIDISSIRTN